MENLSEPLQRSKNLEVQNTVTISGSDPQSAIFNINMFKTGNINPLPKDVSYSNSACTTTTNLSIKKSTTDLTKAKGDSRVEIPEHHTLSSLRSLSPKTNTVLKKVSLDTLSCSQEDAEMLRAVTQDVVHYSEKIIKELEDEINECFVKIVEDVAKNIAKIEKKQNDYYESFINNLHKFMDQEKFLKDFETIDPSTSNTNYTNFT